TDSPTDMDAYSPPSRIPVITACTALIGSPVRSWGLPYGGAVRPGHGRYDDAGGRTLASARSGGQTITQSPSWICLMPTLVSQKLLTSGSKVRWPLNVVSTPFSRR